MWVVIYGNPWQRLYAIGPFSTKKGAEDCIVKSDMGINTIVELENKEGRVSKKLIQ